jgi:hypothetical protein
MALAEVHLRDWWRVMRRELGAGLALGAVLGTIGMTRILLWQAIAQPYGAHYFLVALTVACSLIGVVLFGTLAGSMLPFLLRWLGFDPASASAPFVATLVKPRRATAFGAARHWRFAGGALTPPLTKGDLRSPLETPGSGGFAPPESPCVRCRFTPAASSGALSTIE